MVCCCEIGSQVMTGPLLKPGVGWEGHSGMLKSWDIGKDEEQVVKLNGVDVGIGAYMPEARDNGTLLATSRGRAPCDTGSKWSIYLGGII